MNVDLEKFRKLLAEFDDEAILEMAPAAISEIEYLRAEIELLRGYRDAAEADAAVARLLLDKSRLTETEMDAMQTAIDTLHAVQDQTKDPCAKTAIAAARLMRLRDRLKPIGNVDSDRPQPVRTAEDTPDTQATPGEGSVQERCTLTDAEREAIETAAWACGNCNGFGGIPTRPAVHRGNEIAATLRKLLERLTHDAAPAARAGSDEARTDKAATSHRRDGTGDTPSDADIDALEFVVVMGRIANGWDKDILRQWLIRLRPEFDSAEAIKEGESDRSQPIGSPAETNPTQPRNGTPAEGSVPGEGSVPDSRNWKEPVAWAVEKKGYPPMFAVFNDWNFACRAAMEEYAEIVPLYRHPPCQDLLQKNLTLTDDEREAVEAAIAYLQPVANCDNRLQATLRKLLERLQ